MSYLMAGQLSELERLQLQSRVWEPAGERLLQVLGDGAGRRVVDVGCGCLGWLRILSRWVGDGGAVTVPTSRRRCSTTPERWSARSA